MTKDKQSIQKEELRY